MQHNNIVFLSELKAKLELNSDPTAPLYFLIHGRAGTLDVMSTFKRCIPLNASIVFPEAPFPDPIGGYSWWRTEIKKTPEERRIDVLDAAHRLKDFIDAIILEYHLNPKYIAAYGFSQGAATLSVLIQQYPKLLRKVALLAGFCIQLEEKPDLFGLKIFIANGTKDEVVKFDKALESKVYLEDCKGDVTFISEDIGHKIGIAGIRALKNWSDSEQI